MKNAIAVLSVAVMLLGLVGCASEGQQLYEKYAPIIDMLEAKDYQGAIREITTIAIQEQQGNVEKVPTMQVLADSWYTTSEKAPPEMTFNQDGTCTVGGKAMTWLAEESEDPVNLRAQVFEDGQLQYFLSMSTSDEYAVPIVQLWYAEERDGQVYSGDHVGNYYNHPMLPKLMTSWYAISDYERVTENLSVSNSVTRISDYEYDWTVTDGEGKDSLTIHLEPKRDAAGEYTLTLSLRDGSPVLHVTDDATGKTGLYISYNYEYDRTWPEFSYVEAKENLEEYLANGSFWCEISGESYSDRDDNAIAYLYDQFVSLGDYADAADILANWDAVKFSRANRLLGYFEERNYFWIGETEYNWNLDTLAYIKSQFEEISSYPEAADVLANWDAVLYNRAMYYLEQYLNENSFRVDDVYYGWDSTDTLAYIYAQFAEIADYAEAAAILDRFTTVEDVELYYEYTSVDHMGNEYNSGKSYAYEYNELGQVICFSNYSELQRLYGGYSSNAFYTYGEDGRITEIKLGYTNDVDAVITPTYDDNGNLVQNHVVNNDGEYDIFYTYDDQNRLVEQRRPNTSYDDPENYYYYFKYSYDDAGRLTQKVYGWMYDGYADFEYIYTYTYDAAGNQIQETETYNDYSYRSEEVYASYTHTAECVCDDLGNVIQKNWTYGNTVYNNGSEDRPSNATSAYTYTYGNVYFFDSTGMEISE